jgi:hypothetical protein
VVTQISQITQKNNLNDNANLDVDGRRENKSAERKTTNFAVLKTKIELNAGRRNSFGDGNLWLMVRRWRIINFYL